MFNQALGFLKKMSGNAADEGIEEEEGSGSAGPSGGQPGHHNVIPIDMEMGYDGNGQDWDGEEYMDDDTFQNAGDEMAGWSHMHDRPSLPDLGAAAGLFKESLADSLAVATPAQLSFTVDNPNLDLDAFISPYTGMIKTLRLQHIAKHCPQLRVEALKIALKNIVAASQATGMYTKLYEELSAAIQSGLKGEDGDATLPPFDETWVKETKRNHDAKMEKLEHDLKNYKANSIKESIRRGHDEIAYHYLAGGDAASALRSFNNSRDYAEGPKEQAQLLANRLRACVYMQHFQNPIQLTDQMRELESSLERANAAAVKEAKAKDKENNGNVFIANAVVATDKGLEQSWNLVRACMAVYRMSSGSYKDAADLFTSLVPEACDFPMVIVGRDIAVYGTLCALAAYDRQTLKDKVINNKNFKSFLENAPEIRNLIENFHKSKFRQFLQAFEEQRNTLLLDLLFASHVEPVFRLIRQRGIVEYFRCYASVTLAEMAQEFRYTVAELQEELVKMILGNQLPARIDSLQQVLNRDTPNTFLETASKIQHDLSVLQNNLHFCLLRSTLMRADVQVKSPKEEGFMPGFYG
ncbi:hypothetical protein RvY_04772 [Ramazzottius varieornatus]|uniref:PCI domain-containing protein n=1 Tax=Ramazzottius varieornatus TaxID=947166 RepID=A0A1D1UW76_RAMVA|nr:hypothetical protein RvY_04772 [Ramazzottius varieornatus]